MAEGNAAVYSISLDFDSNKFLSKIENTFKKAGSLNVDINMSSVKKKISKTFSNKQVIKADADTSKLKSRLQSIFGKKKTVKIDGNTSQVEKRLKEIKETKCTVKVDADTSTAESKIRKIKNTSRSATAGGGGGGDDSDGNFTGGGANNLISKAGSIGKKIAAGFAIKAAVDFGKSCVDLGSDLTEVQNVVDTAFPTMSANINKFAETAAEKFGLSETMAKRYSGTLGAMAEAFGFSESAAAEMSTSLTGLAGDVASFYNISQDEAYTKLKSVFTGETESLKELGVVMTQTALDQYAMANGFDKTTSAMSEAEKVALRYQFVQSQLSVATGDFAKTASGSWANQIRILSLQFDSLRATLGQIIIKALLPLVKAINIVLGKIINLAKAWASFFGIDTSSVVSAAGDITSGIGDINSSIGSAGTAASNASQKAETANKKLQRTIAGFDKINKLSDNSTSSTSSGSGGGNGNSSGSGGSVGTGSLSAKVNIDDASVDKTNSKLQALKEYFGVLKKEFERGFELGEGDVKTKIENIKNHIDGIKLSIQAIISDEDVQEAADTFAKKLSFNFGRVIGSVKSIGLSIGDWIVGGIDDYLGRSKVQEQYKTILTDFFSAGSIIADLAGEISGWLAKVFNKLDTKDAKKYLGDAIEAVIDNTLPMRIINLQLNGKKLWENLGPETKKAWEETGNTIKRVVENCKKNVEEFKQVWANLKDKTVTLYTQVKETIKGELERMKASMDNITDGTVVKYVTGKITETYNNAKKTFDSWKDSAVTKKISANIQSAFTKAKSTWDSWKDSTVTKKISADIQSAYTKAKSAWDSWKDSTVTKKISANIQSAFTKAKSAWDSLKDKTINIKMTLDDKIGSIKNWVNTNIVAKINNLLNKVKLGNAYLFGKKDPIPKLAQGGYVKANTPQLAMIGDNRHQGEIVAPEGKLQDMANRAAAGSGNRIDNDIVILLMKILKAIEKIDPDVYLDGKKVTDIVVKDLNKRVRECGTNGIIV